MLKKYVLLLVVAVVLFAACEKKSPKRDQIPLLQNQVLGLQTAVKDRNRAAIDSLLSVKILDRGQGSDSLLGFVYGPSGDFAFERFGNCDIAYTQDRARIDCFIMDSTVNRDRPITFFLAIEHDLWLFTSFEEGKVEPEEPVDSADTAVLERPDSTQ